MCVSTRHSQLPLFIVRYGIVGYIIIRWYTLHHNIISYEGILYDTILYPSFNGQPWTPPHTAHELTPAHATPHLHGQGLRLQ
jgi:hypothetical protein